MNMARYNAFTGLITCVLLFLLPIAHSASTEGLLADERNTIDIFDRMSPLVVYVHKIKHIQGDYFDTHEVRSGSGSGFFWDKKGHIVTSYHVVRGARKIAVSFNHGQIAKAEVIGVDRRNDIAVLRLLSPDQPSFFESLPSLDIANVNELLVGQKTIAIGNPFGLDRTLTTGIISALGRRVPGLFGLKLRDMIQTDASINPGNSGGPLLDSRGQLIGMNILIFSRSGGSAGIGFAVPASTIRRVVNQIIQHGRVIQSGLGIQRLSDQVARQLGIEGVIIADVILGSPAARAGLKGATRDQFGQVHLGDVIVGVNGKLVKNYADLLDVLEATPVGAEVELKCARGEEEILIKMKTIDLSSLMH